MTKVLKIILGITLGALVGWFIGIPAGYLSLGCFMDGLIVGGRRVPAEQQIYVVKVICTLLGAVVAVGILNRPEKEVRR